VSNRYLAEFHQAVHDDNVDYMAGRLSHKQYWKRVHAQDAIVLAAPPGDRHRLQDFGPDCGCAFCRTLPHPGCQCGHCG